MEQALNTECQWPMGKPPTQRQQDKAAVCDEIREIRKRIQACFNKIPDRVLKGDFMKAQQFKSDHEFAVTQVQLYSYDSASYSLNALKKKRDYLLTLLAGIS